MNQKFVKKLLTYLTTALACASACATVLVGNPSSVSLDTGESEIIQDGENLDTEDTDKNADPGVSPLNNKGDSEIIPDKLHD